MPAYRFDFETDQQYNARVGNPSPAPAVTSTPSAPAVQAPTTMHATTAVPVAPQVHPPASGGQFFSVPWWTFAIAILILVVSMYETNRREMAKFIRAQGLADEKPAAAPRRTLWRRRVRRFFVAYKRWLSSRPRVHRLRATPPPIFRRRPVPDLESVALARTTVRSTPPRGA